MIGLENPPPPSGESANSGEWDKSGGGAPKWRRYKWYEPYTKTIVIALIGVVFGSVGTLMTGSFMASRSESFQLE